MYSTITPASTQLNTDAAHVRTAMHDLFVNLLRATLHEGKITPTEYDRALALFEEQFEAQTETRAQIATVGTWCESIAAFIELRGLAVQQ